MDNASNPFIGTGWSFPPSFHYDSGTVELVSGVEDIEESLGILLSTSLGERVMQPKYGCNLANNVFDSLDSGTIGYLKDRVKNSILFYESRIVVESIDVTPPDSMDLFEGKFTIQVSYSIPGTNSRFNYVYDYYINEAAKPV